MAKKTKKKSKKRLRPKRHSPNLSRGPLDLALCMIVKDEEVMLGACLDSVRDLVTEIVVVDTGSSDRTPAVAQEAGAQVVNFPWCDDFAAARNAALPHLKASWILMLDADERLAPGAGESIRRAIVEGQVDCGFLPLLDADSLDASPEDVLDGGSLLGDPSLLPRLFRNVDDFAWEGVVHESMGTWLERGPKRCARIDAPLIHYGNVPEYRGEKSKSDRNLRLLKKAVAEQPGDPTLHGYLAREYIRQGALETADHTINQGWAAARKAYSGDAPSHRPAIVQLASLRAFRALARGDYDVTIDCEASLSRWGVRHPNLSGMKGMALHRLACASPEGQRPGLLAAAAQALGECLGMADEMFTDEVMPGITRWVGASEMGAVALQLGEAVLALEAFEAALGSAPGHPDALFGRAEALLHLGRTRDALTALEPLLPNGGADEWALGSAICAAMGRLDDAQLFAKKAASIGPVGVDHPYRRIRYGS